MSIVSFFLVEEKKYNIIGSENDFCKCQLVPGSFTDLPLLLPYIHTIKHHHANCS